MNRASTDAPPVEIETGPGPSAAVIWLHGLGADGHDFEPIVPELRLPRSQRVRFVFPHAPLRPVTLNSGSVMRAWYDMAIRDGGISIDREHLRESERLLHGLIRREQERGVRAARIVLAGFSQGGSVALYTGLRHTERLAGILALSTVLPAEESLMDEVQPANAGLPIFLAHGSADPLIPFPLAQRARAILEPRGFDLEWHAYPMEHAVCAEEVRDIARWLARVLPPEAR